MAQALVESIFDVCYLSFAFFTAYSMLSGKKDPLIQKGGFMVLLLALGDSFHLLPRMYALWTSGLEANAVALGVGKFITSVTMTVFYLILYYIWREYYRIEGRQSLTAGMWGLAAIRIALCLLPQNQWLSYRQPLLYGILRNIPFAVMGILIIFLFLEENRKNGASLFQSMPLAVFLSFGFYLPVVLFSGSFPLIGMLMIPKTLAYIWIIVMNRQLYRQRILISKEVLV